MQYRVVAGSELTPKSLKASDYVPASKQIAKEIVTAWVAEHPVLSRRSKPIRDLEARIAVAIQKSWSLIR